jgi:hypothetical protein
MNGQVGREVLGIDRKAACCIGVQVLALAPVR